MKKARCWNGSPWNQDEEKGNKVPQGPGGKPGEEDYTLICQN